MTTLSRLIELSEAEMTNETTTPTVDWSDWTADQLAGFGDRVEQAQRDRAAREHAAKARQRQRASDERRLAKVESEIPPLEAAIAERRPAVEELTRRYEAQRSKLADLIDREGHLANLNPTHRQTEAHLMELGRALTQARDTGNELIEGVSATEGGGGLMVSYSPVSRRVNHPILDEVGGDIDWSTPLAPLVEELEKLTAERDKLQKRLGVTE